MKIKNVIILLALTGVLGVFSSFAHCGKCEHDNIITYEYAEEQAEVMAAMGQIEKYIREHDVDGLISCHAYGPKFTEFNGGAPRVGAAENEKFERDFFGSVTDITKWDANDLKIAVYGGDVANVTFHADFQPKVGDQQLVIKAQISLLFVKVDGEWKIVAEHHSPLNATGDSHT